MAYKVAVASSDGKVINQHFGRATKFLIFEVNDSKYKFVEQRDSAPFCNNGEHDDSKLLSSVEALADCRAVLVAQIGQGAVVALNEKDIDAFNIHDLIEEALENLVQYYSDKKEQQ
ncbi:MAG: NifB/NifX family molybdenum-iron cluster-binding protein [Bacillota bacterium]|nr:NifB/NifX family molybdenum-iron cluster-binding protein [Bacillota bacterium]